MIDKQYLILFYSVIGTICFLCSPYASKKAVVALDYTSILTWKCLKLLSSYHPITRCLTCLWPQAIRQAPWKFNGQLRYSQVCSWVNDEQFPSTNSLIKTYSIDSILVGLIGVKNKHDTAFCDEELKFDTVMEEAMKSKTGERASYYWSWLCDWGGGTLWFSRTVCP